ncbi:MAG: UDP-N-acetylglucosamine--N-acetylmuramyl-(pentapeptide) pyrophosphoryl-undecaprenol N-acetylglucosamine transferase [Oscillospiraceae bacterium]|nr:UDP-N-acetylglucosamine--N-acetylmuramyl-(pentapeptide) pyrophosphoryl-undecaprenol N-acetylglucosamine transferase [Oscillospiraceae bacterium]
MRFLFTCGGTAGHINPALGVAGRIRDLLPDAEILFVGAEYQMETELVPREGYDLRTVRIFGFQRSLRPKMMLENIQTLGWLVKSSVQARWILKEFRPDVAVGTGGYVCYPVLKAAASLGVPTAVHESNAVPGLTTRLLEKKMDRILVGFEGSRSYYHHPDRVEVTGTPVRMDFRGADKGRARRELGMDAQEPIVLAVFGSLGADYMNGVMMDFIRRMGPKPGFRLIYATGKQYYERVQTALTEEHIASPAVDVREYIYDMPKVMAAADVIICRSGASTISELTYLGKPAVIVPSPNVVNNHQEKNARVLADAGAARMLLEGAIDGAALYNEVTSLLHDPQAMARMHMASRNLGVDDATDRITSIVLGLAQKDKKE